MRYIPLILASSAALAFASSEKSNAAGGTASKPAAPVAPPAPVVNAGEVTILPIRADIPVPEIKSKRGSKSKYNLGRLEVGNSIGVIGRTAKSLNSTINGEVRKHSTQKKDATTGELLFEMIETKDASGNITGRHPNKAKPIMEKTREFLSVDTDPATDPDKASARIFRVK